MKFDPELRSLQAVALVFPGQGVRDFRLLEDLRAEPEFRERYEVICHFLNCDVLQSIRSRPSMLQQNAVSSLLIVLASSILIDKLRRDDLLQTTIGFAGYSVGQWTALYAAGAIDLPTLFGTVHTRAKLMDEHLLPGKSGMIGVIGIREAELQACCARASAGGMMLEVANFNAPAHYSLSGGLDALSFAETELAVLRPKLLTRLPVSGAWHSSQLAPAIEPFRDYLETLQLSPPSFVVDNTTGDWFPRDREAVVERLSHHLAMPVLWSQCVRTLQQAGAKTFLEVGIGDTLTKFGFFISRRAKHIAIGAAAAAA